MTYDKDNIVFQPKPTIHNFRDITDMEIGRLIVLGYAGVKHNRSSWWCECECGTIKIIRGSHLVHQKIKSCGCLQQESGKNRTTHGESSSNHGGRTPECQAYYSIQQRCYNPRTDAYQYYGAKGIECHFESFEQFLNDIGRRPTPQHSVDRKNTRGHYEVGNVWWATRQEQARNKTNNHLITANGLTYCIAEWADVLGVDARLLALRSTRSQWCDDCTINIPVNGGRCSHISS